MTKLANDINVRLWAGDSVALAMIPKRITDALIARTTDTLTLELLLIEVTYKMQQKLQRTRDMANTMESNSYSMLSIKAENLLEKLQTINPEPIEGDCRYTELNVGNFLA